MTNYSEIALLSALGDVGEFSMPKKTLFADVNIRMPANRVMTHADFDDLLHRAQEKHRIICLTGEDDVKIKITDDGRLRLAELRR